MSRRWEMSRKMAGRASKPKSKVGTEGDGPSSGAARATEGQEARRHVLFAQLGELLYEETKDDERFFLMAPDLYLAIARCDDEVTGKAG